VKKRERKAGLARMRAYVAALQPALLLQHWDIRVGKKPPQNPNFAADCYRVPRMWVAWLHFADDFFAKDPEAQRETVVHELLHIVRSAEQTAVFEAFNGLDQTGRAWAWERFDHEQEFATDHLARVIAPFLPLPPTAEKG
jgi:hypothetical protein